MAAIEKDHWWFVARRQILSSLIEKFIFTANPKILEIGAGTGGNLEMLIQHGSVTAVEPNIIARNRIQKNFAKKITLIDGRLPDELNLENQKFDVICLFDVLEHIEDDQAALLNIKKHLASNGKIILTVPAFQFLFSDHDKKLHHFRRYNKDNLTKLIKACGLETKAISYFNFFLFPIAFLTRLLKKIFPSIKLEEKTPSPFLNKIFGKIFVSEKFFLKNGLTFPFGLSLFVILK